MKLSIKSTAFIVLVLMLVVSIGCQALEQTSNGHISNTPSVAPAPAYDMAAKSSVGSSYAGEGSISDAVDRKIVQTGSMTLEVNNISGAQDAIAVLAVQLKGYVVSSSQRADDDNPSGSISIRIPAGSFNEAIQQLHKLSIKVIYETTNSQDVTEQYMDLSAQLKNLEATEAQYLELMKKADNVKDTLEVQRELSTVRGEIERIKGRMQYLERTSDMSLIDISLQKTRPIGESKWDVTGIFKSAVDGLITFSQILAGILIWLLVFSPIWIVIILIIFFIRRRKKAKS